MLPYSVIGLVVCKTQEVKPTITLLQEANLAIGVLEISSIKTLLHHPWYSGSFCRHVNVGLIGLIYKQGVNLAIMSV